MAAASFLNSKLVVIEGNIAVGKATFVEAMAARARREGVLCVDEKIAVETHVDWIGPPHNYLKRAYEWTPGCGDSAPFEVQMMAQLSLAGSARERLEAALKVGSSSSSSGGGADQVHGRLRVRSLGSGFNVFTKVQHQVGRITDAQHEILRRHYELFNAMYETEAVDLRLFFYHDWAGEQRWPIGYTPSSTGEPPVLALQWFGTPIPPIREADLSVLKARIALRGRDGEQFLTFEYLTEIERAYRAYMQYLMQMGNKVLCVNVAGLTPSQLVDRLWPSIDAVIDLE